MKVKSLNKKNALITGFRDEKPKKKKNWDRLIYIIILIVLCSIGGYFLVDYLCYVSGKGQVVMETIDIRVPRNVRIMHFYKSEGDKVKANDTLFSYVNEENGFAITDSSKSDAHLNPEWVEKELFSLREKIKLNEVDINELRQQLKIKQHDYREAQAQVKLNVLPYDNLYRLKENMEDIKSRITTLEQGNHTNLQMAEALAMKLKDNVVKENAYYDDALQYLSMNDERNMQFYYAPADGYINSILKKASELSIQESILLLQREDKLFVRAYFDSKYIRSIKENDTVNIVFPDDVKSLGIVKRLYAPVLPDPLTLQGKMEDLEESVYGVDIYPVNRGETSNWKVYTNLNVNVFKSKFR